MHTHAAAEQLRRRAAALRTLARQLDGARVLDLYQRAGTDTWVGPSQFHCEQSLRTARSSLLTIAVDLFAQADRMERAAAHIDALARSAAR